VISWLVLGFAMGLRHSLEADHMAAVASLSTRAPRLRDRIRVAGAWGIGHALTLLAVALAWALAGVAIPEPAQPYFEAAAGLLLLFLGSELIWRPAGSMAHGRSHRYADRRALFVGSVHGLAGSALIGLLAAGNTDPHRAIAYAGVFGFGAAAGMVALTIAISFPLQSPLVRGIGSLRWWRAAVALTSIAVGTWIIVRSSLSIASATGA
jgi:hypothetical protein